MLLCVHLFLLQVNPIVRRATLTMFLVCFLLSTSRRGGKKDKRGQRYCRLEQRRLEQALQESIREVQEQMEEQEKMEQDEQEQIEQMEE